jgi:hypothetical protein
LPNTLSACARLVPPAPSAFSNSDLLSLPSLSASICANRSFSASDRPLDADGADAVVAWLCAASSALIVAGEICEPPPAPDLPGEASDAVLLPERSNGLFGSCLLPADFDAVSDFRRSSADVAAPRASSMTKLHQMPRGAACYFHADGSANSMPSRKANKTAVFVPARPQCSRQ